MPPRLSKRTTLNESTTSPGASGSRSAVFASGPGLVSSTVSDIATQLLPQVQIDIGPSRVLQHGVEPSLTLERHDGEIPDTRGEAILTDRLELEAVERSLVDAVMQLVVVGPPVDDDEEGR